MDEDSEKYAMFLIEPYTDYDKAIFLDLWKTRVWSMLDILNAYWYIKDATKVHVILDMASSLGLHPSDICSLLRK